MIPIIPIAIRKIGIQLRERPKSVAQLQTINEKTAIIITITITNKKVAYRGF
ncbi:MAG: hypothetical protein WCJ45_03805 [bacterium]